MQSFLIAGSDPQEREKKAEEIFGKLFTELNHSPDFILLSSETSIGIDEIRHLQKTVSLKPFQDQQKTVLIKEAQALTIEAQNSLLKTLEEPPSDTIIILTAPDTSALLPTVVSRCQIVALASKKAAILDNEEEKELSNLLDSLLKANISQRTKTIGENPVIKDRNSAEVFLDKIQIFLRQMLRRKFEEQAQNNDEFGLSSQNIVDIISLADKTKKYLKANCNVKLCLDLFAIDLPIPNR